MSGCNRCNDTGTVRTLGDWKSGIPPEQPCQCSPLYRTGKIGKRLEHEESEHCWCEPEIERYEGGDVIIHRRAGH